MGSISAVARYCREHGRTLRVLWLDAHTDFNTDLISPSGNMHGMPAACLRGYGPDELTHLGGYSPALSASDIRQIGIRSVDPPEKRLVCEAGVEIHDMRAIDEKGMRPVKNGSAHVGTTITNAHLECRLLLEKKKTAHAPK